MADGSGPTIVHCSAGVGRTGTLLTLDIGIQGILQGDSKIDVLRIVSTLRQDRPGMVQTKDQYRFVHQVCHLSVSHVVCMYRCWHTHNDMNMWCALN